MEWAVFCLGPPKVQLTELPYPKTFSAAKRRELIVVRIDTGLGLQQPKPHALYNVLDRDLLIHSRVPAKWQDAKFSHVGPAIPDSWTRHPTSTSSSNSNYHNQQTSKQFHDALRRRATQTQLSRAPFQGAPARAVKAERSSRSVALPLHRAAVLSPLRCLDTR